MSATVGVRELRQNLSAVLRRVQGGERLIVTERNRAVAELAPVSERSAGFARLVAEGMVAPPSAPLDFTPVRLRGAAARPASESLEYVRGEHE
jgi:prevent-host-death family protein